MKKKKKDSRNQSTVASYSARIAQKHWMYSDIYIEGKREYKQKTKKKVATAATVLLGIVATVVFFFFFSNWFMFFFLILILVDIYIVIMTQQIFTIIDVSISYKLK